MTIDWTTDDDDLHFAVQAFGSEYIVHLAVESLGETGWDWHVWDAFGRTRPLYGLADSLVPTLIEQRIRPADYRLFAAGFHKDPQHVSRFSDAGY